MILLDNLYKILQEPERQSVPLTSAHLPFTPYPLPFTIAMLPESEIYRAHFPEEAITPGACLVGIVRELAEKALGKSLQIKQIKNLKFLQPLYPTKDGPTVQVSLNFKTEDSVQAEIRTADTVICKMTLSF